MTNPLPRPEFRHPKPLPSLEELRIKARPAQSAPPFKTACDGILHTPHRLPEKTKDDVLIELGMAVWVVTRISSDCSQKPELVKHVCCTMTGPNELLRWETRGGPGQCVRHRLLEDDLLFADYQLARGFVVAYNQQKLPIQ